MKKSRKIVVDKKFQIGLAASVTALSALTFSIVILIIAVTSMDNSRKLDVVAHNQQSLSGNQEEIFKTLISFSQMKDLTRIRIHAQTIDKDIKINRAQFSENTKIMLEINRNNKILILILIIFVTVQSVFLFYLLIKRSHRISGPVFLLNRYISELKKGKFPEIRPLRTRDDFKDLFDNFREMVDYFKKKRRTVSKKD